MKNTRTQWFEWVRRERFILYGITDRTLTHVSHAQMVQFLVEHGVRMIQLREKEGDDRYFYTDAQEAVRIAHAHHAWVLINDRPDICILTNADGVHLGEDDLPVHAARELIPDKLIGLSTHSIDQFTEAQRNLDVDYVSFGPIHRTRTKPDYGVRTEDEIKAIFQHKGIKPTCLIGGIKPEDIKDYGGGPYLYGVIRGIWEGDWGKNIGRYMGAIDNFR